MIPQAAPLAEWCDVFCDRGFFTPTESTAILEAGRARRARSRASTPTSWRRAADRRWRRRCGARSADHLVYADADGIAALAGAGVIATLLPCAAFYLKLGRFAPARDLIAAGVPVALATDVNPGGGISPSMPFAMTLACFAMGMTFEEALVAATINGAASLDRDDRIGSLEPGKQFDAVLVDGPGHRTCCASNTQRDRGGVQEGRGRRGRSDLTNELARSPLAPLAPSARGRCDTVIGCCTLASPDLLDAFASSDPTPGGGSAAALSGALGASLLAMVAGLPKTKNRHAGGARGARRGPRAGCSRSAATLIDLIDRDAAAYDLVVAAFKRPKATDEREGGAEGGGSGRDASVAAEVPLETMRACAEALRGRAARWPSTATRRRRATSPSATQTLMTRDAGRAVQRRGQPRERQDQPTASVSCDGDKDRASADDGDRSVAGARALRRSAAIGIAHAAAAAGRAAEIFADACGEAGSARARPKRARRSKRWRERDGSGRARRSGTAAVGRLPDAIRAAGPSWMSETDSRATRSPRARSR